MKRTFIKTKTWALGMALVCLSALGTVAAQPAPPGGAPANDLCANATPISCGDALAGSNIDATEQAVPTTGGTVGPGVWYTFTGDGNDVTLSTCNAATFDTEINVVTSPDCINFTNVAGNDDFTGCAGATSELTFTSLVGTVYYVYVSDYISGGSNAGTFTLSMTCAPPPPPANDVCGGAISLNCGDDVTGSIGISATTTDEPACIAGLGQPGVWYSFVGDGSSYDIALDAPGFDPYLIVTTTCAPGATCDATNDDGGGGLNSLISGFATTNGVTYYIYVWENSISSLTMNFELSLSSSACAPPANDLCANAEAITCGDALAGSTEFGTQQAIDGSAGIGVWYTFTGDGGDVTLSTCNAASFDTEITVMTSPDCAAFTQVAFNDDNAGAGCAGNTSELTFTTVDAETYYVYVSHWQAGSTTTGTFTLSMTCPPPANNECSTAQALACGESTSGATVNADATDQPSCLNGASPGVWYSFVGDGTDYIIDVTSPGFDPAIVVTGTCTPGTPGNCDIVESGTGSVSATVPATTNGTTYYVYVLENNFNEMSFDLSLSSSACTPPANDLCTNAETITCGDVLAGSTAFGTQQAIDGSAGIGVWYTFQGTGLDITLSTCNDADFDTEITVMTSPDCSSFTQVAFNDDNSGAGCGGNTSLLTFTSTYDETYYVYVSHWQSGSTVTGTFNLTMTCATPVNDLCADALPIACGDVVQGNNYNSTVSVDESCAEINAGNGVWYTMVGTGEDVTVSTCSPNTDFDTELVVTSGDCASQTCVAANDDDFNCPDNGLFSTLTFYAEPGETYNIYVSNYDPTSGTPFGEFELSVTCACPTIDAGSLTADAASVCMSGGSATVSATENVAPTVPTGYAVAYVLTSGAGLDIVDVQASPSFSVAAAGDYTIHTLVLDPADQATLLAETTGGGVAALLSGNGGTPLCGALDVTGAPVTVNPEPTATLSGDVTVCDGNAEQIQIDLTGVGPWDVVLATPSQNVDLLAITSSPMMVNVVSAGSYTLVSVNDANCPGTVSGTATVTEDLTAESAWSFAQVTNTLDVDFTDASLNSPTSWLWDFGDGNTSTAASPTHTYAADGTYTVCLTVTNNCGSDSACAAVVVDPVSLAPANDLCGGAITVNCGDVVSGNTDNATADDAPQGVSEGLWYVFSGTGDNVTASTCDAADFDTEIVVSTGSCGNLTFLANNDDDFTNCTGNTSQLTFATQVGVDYYIYVGDYSTTVGGTNTGNFDLSITCVAPPQAPANDLCSGAVAVTCGSTTAGTTVGSTATDVPNGEFGTPVSSEGVWYSITGTGDIITAATCGATWDMEIVVVEGACGGAQTFVASDDDGCDPGLQSIVSWSSTLGVEYYIYVADFSTTTGPNGNEGEFDLAITCQAPLANDDCQGAEMLTVGTSCVTTAGTVDGATESLPGCAGTADDDVWFSFVADATTATVDVTGAADFDAVFEVFDACGGTSLACIDATLDGETETTDLTGLTPGNTYYVRVYHWYAAASTTPTFDICVYNVVTGINEALDNSLSVYPNPSNGEFVVEIRGVEADAQLNVLDLAGRVIYAEGAVLNGDYRKDLNLDVATGTYLLQIATEEGMVTRKIQIH